MMMDVMIFGTDTCRKHEQLQLERTTIPTEGPGDLGGVQAGFN